jgi:Tautomerase enzyme
MCRIATGTSAGPWQSDEVCMKEIKNFINGKYVGNVRVWIHDVPSENWGIAGVPAKDLGR